MKSGIGAIENKINKKRFFFYSKNIDRQIKRFKIRLKEHTIRNKALFDDLETFGEENFDVIILETGIDQFSLNQACSKYIENYPQNYNKSKNRINSGKKTVKLCGIAAIENKKTSKRYYFHSRDINSRMGRFKERLNKGTFRTKGLQKDWNELGESNFEFKIIEINEDKTILSKRKLELIKEYSNTYNSSKKRKNKYISKTNNKPPETVNSGIGAILNKSTGESYIFYSRDLDALIERYTQSLKENEFNNKRLQEDWNTLGSSNFEFIKLEYCEADNNIFYDRKNYYLEKYPDNYNKQKQKLRKQSKEKPKIEIDEPELKNTEKINSGIGAIVNKTNDKRYIFYSRNFNSFIKNSIQNLNNNFFNCNALQEDWNKLGENNFEFVCLEYCVADNNIFYARKEYYIKKYFNNYNESKTTKKSPSEELKVKTEDSKNNSEKSGIGAIVNKKKNKKFIYSSRDLVKVKHQFISLLEQGKFRNKKLQKDWNKLGKENFEFIILEANPQDVSLTQREHEFIVRYPHYQLYNPIPGIYKIINTRTSETYIGQSSNLSKRLNGHIKKLKEQTHANKRLLRDFNKGDIFIFEVIALESSKNKRDDIEAIEIMNNNTFMEGYNQTPGGKYDKYKGKIGFGGGKLPKSKYHEVPIKEPYFHKLIQ